MRKHYASKHQETLDIEKTSGEKNVSATVVGQFVAKSSSHEKGGRVIRMLLLVPLNLQWLQVQMFRQSFIQTLWKFHQFQIFPEVSSGFIKFHPPKIWGVPDVSRKPSPSRDLSAPWTPPPRGAKAVSKAAPSKAAPLDRRQPGEPRGAVGGWNHPKSMGWRIIVYIIHHPKSMVNINQLCW